MSNGSINVIYGLLCACHPADGVRYVGLSTRTASRRFMEHLRAAEDESERSPVYRWIRKHGAVNIRCVVLEVVDSIELLPAREIHWIAKLGTYCRAHRGGLNLTIGGEGGLAYVHTEETRQRMSDAAKRRGAPKVSPEARAKTTGERNRNAKLTDADVLTIKRMIWDGESVCRIAEVMNVSKGTISKISTNRAWLHVPWPVGPRREPPTAVLLAEVNKGREMSPESIEKMKVGQRASWTAERREKESVRLSGVNNPMYGKTWTKEQKAAASLTRSPLSAEDVREIRRLRVEEGLQYAEIATIVGKGTSAHTVGSIVRGQKFQHVV